MADISPGICILTASDLQRRLDAEYQRGVARGKFEASAAARSERVSRNCANWTDGRCQSCGAQWQDMEVGPDFKCPHFRARASQEQSHD